MTIRKTTSVAAIKVNTALAHAHVHGHGHSTPHAHPNVVIIASPSRRTSLLQRQVSRALEIIDLYDDDDAASGVASPRVRLAPALPDHLSLAASGSSLSARKSVTGATAKTAVFQISPVKRKRSASLSSLSGAAAVDDMRGNARDCIDTATANPTRSHRNSKTRDGSSRSALQSKRCSSKDKKKRLKVDVVERALKRFHSSRCVVDMDERCFDFTSAGRSNSNASDETATCKTTSAVTMQASSSSNARLTRRGTPMRVQIGVAAAQGTRAYMEDRFAVTTHLFEDRVDEELPRDASLFALYDGHNGIMAADLAVQRYRELLSEQDYLLELCRRPNAGSLETEDIQKIESILTDACARVDEEVLELTQKNRRRDGCTVLIGLLVLGKLFVANLGDSRGVLGSIEDTTVERISVDHKPNLPEEAARIEAMGGKVMFSGCWRVAHDNVPLRLAVSRSLGDHPLKTNLPSSCSGPLVSVVPSIHIVDVDEMDDSLVVFATDGLWDRLSDEDAIRIARTRLAAKEKPRAQENAMYDAAHALVDAALRKRSMDNITAMVIGFSNLRNAEHQPDEEATTSEDALSDDASSVMEL